MLQVVAGSCKSVTGRLQVGAKWVTGWVAGGYR